MIDKTLIRKAFRQRLVAVPDLSGSLDVERQIAWENREFTPPNPPDVWLRENFNWGQETLIATNLLEQITIVQFDVMDVIGKGNKRCEQLSKAIGDWFKPGTPLVGGGRVQIAIQRTWTEKGMESSIGEQVWYQLPVRVLFRAYDTNND